MKKLKYVAVIGIVAFLTMFCLPKVFAKPLVINVSPNDIGANKTYKNLQEVFDAVEEGGTLNLAQGDYQNGKDSSGLYNPVVINKSMTVNGAGDRTIIWAPIQIKETTKENEVVLNNFARPIYEPASGTIFINVQSSVNLSILNSKLFYIVRDVDREVETLHVQKEAKDSTILIKDSDLRANFDGIFVESSNNNITIDNSTVTGRYALTFKDGENNNVNIINHSEIQGRIYITDRVSQEAIRIINEKNLTFHVIDSDITAVSSSGTRETHVISFDGTQPSSNVKVIFEGNSKFIDADPQSVLISFGSSNKSSYNNVLTFENTVEMTSNVAMKYDDAEGGDYHVVGIFDKEGNLVVKSYDMGSTIAADDLPKEVAGYRLDGLYKKYSNGEYTDKFNPTDPVSENMDLYPKYVRLVDVTIGAKKYTIDENQKLNDAALKEEIKQSLTELKNHIETSEMTFVGFSDGKEQIASTIEELMEKSFDQNVTITALSKIVLTLKYGEESKTYDYESGVKLNDLYQEFVDTASSNLVGKSFGRIYDESDVTKAKIDSNTQFTKNTTLQVVYTVTVKYGTESVTIDENETIESVYTKWETQASAPTDKTFVKFVNEDGEVVDGKTTITKNMVLTPKYTVTVQFGENYTKELEEGSVIGDIEYNKLLDLATATDKKFHSFKIKGTSEAVGPDTPIHKNVVLEASYNIDVTYGEVTIPLAEGDALGKENYDKLVAEAKKGTEGKKDYHRLVDGDTTIAENSTFTKNTTLNAIYTLQVTFNGKDAEITIEVGNPLGQENYDKLVALATAGISNKTFGYLKTSNGEKVTKDTVFEEHTDVTPVYLVHVTFNDTKIELEEGTILGEDNYNALVGKAKENITGKTFKKFVDPSKNEVTKDSKITQDTTLQAIYEVHVSYQGEVVLTLEEGTTLTKEDYAKLEALAKATGKTLASLKVGNDTLKEGDVISKDIEVVAVYSVKVTYKDVTIVLEEGTKLTEQQKTTLTNAAKEENKEFAYFLNGEHQFDFDHEIFEDTTLAAFYHVKVTIGEEVFLIDEKTALDNSDDFDLIYLALEALKNAKEKEFSRFVDEKGNTIETDTVIDHNITISAKFYITVTIDDEKFTLEENQTLNDLSSADKERVKSLKEKTGYKFVGFKDSDGNDVKETDSFDDDITLTSVFVKVDIPEVPSTFDDIAKYIGMGMIGLVGLVGCVVAFKKQNKKKLS